MHCCKRILEVIFLAVERWFLQTSEGWLTEKEWVVHPSKKVKQPACVLLPKTTYVLPPVSLMVFITFLSTMMHLLPSQFYLACEMLGVYVEMISQILIGNITMILKSWWFVFLIFLMWLLFYLWLDLFSPVLGLIENIFVMFHVLST